jgi:hypothetical protein
LDRTVEFPQLLSEDYRRSSNHLISCSKLDCDINRLTNNYHYLTSLAYQWNKEKSYTEHALIKFVRRAQTSLLQYDEHNHQLWFTCDHTLRCLNLNNNHLDYSYEYFNDDILCYKIYNDHFICLAHGNQLTIICRQTNEFYPCQIDQQLYGERNDILSLDVYSNDQERYLVLNGSRDHTVSSKFNRRKNRWI